MEDKVSDKSNIPAFDLVLWLCLCFCRDCFDTGSLPQLNQLVFKCCPWPSNNLTTVAFFLLPFKVAVSLAHHYCMQISQERLLRNTIHMLNSTWRTYSIQYITDTSCLTGNQDSIRRYNLTIECHYLILDISCCADMSSTLQTKCHIGDSSPPLSISKLQWMPTSVHLQDQGNLPGHDITVNIMKLLQSRCSLSNLSFPGSTSYNGAPNYCTHCLSFWGQNQLALNKRSIMQHSWLSCHVL